MKTATEEERKALLDQINRTKSLPQDYLRCRRGALGHHWRLVQPDREPGRGTREVAMQCRDCLTIKRLTVGLKYGDLIGWPSYEYPEGYLLEQPDGSPPIAPQAVRAVFTGRIGDDLPPMERLD